MPREGRIPVGSAQLYYREVGQGPPVIVVHGGPDFDHRYLLPDLDRLSDGFRLIYYDQRGRGRSAEGVQPEDVSVASEVEDLEAVRAHFHLESTVVLGHSWGAFLALAYALRHPSRASHLILLHPAPASHDDFMLLRQERRRRWPEDVAQLVALAATARYEEGDPETVAAYYRIHFRAGVKRPEDLDRLMASFRPTFTREGILKGRRIEDRLMAETWRVEGYDLLPRLAGLTLPTLVLRGDHDFIPAACAEHIARAIPKARYVSLSECGHFGPLECPGAVRREIDALLQPPRQGRAAE